MLVSRYESFMLTSVKYFNKVSLKVSSNQKYFQRIADDTPTIYKYNDKCCLVFGIRKLIYQEEQAKTRAG